MSLIDQTRPEDQRAVDLLVQLRERGAKHLATKLAGRIGSENESALLSAIHQAEAYLDVAGAGRKAVTDKPWDGSAGRFTDEQYQRSTVLDRKVCGGNVASAPPKTRCSLPILEPDGTLNRNAVHAAAAALAGGRGGVSACPAAISAAKRRIRGAYSTLGETAPEGLS